MVSIWWKSVRAGRGRKLWRVFGAFGSAACAGTDHVGPGYYSTIYTPGLVSYATSKQEMATEMRGDLPGDAEAVAAVLRPPGWFSPFRFTTKPQPETPSAYRVVLHFDPAVATISGEKVCLGERSPDSTPPLERTRIQAVFCAGDRFVSEANGYAARPGSPADPALRAVLDQLLATLLPPRNPDIDRRDPICRFMFC